MNLENKQINMLLRVSGVEFSSRIPNFYKMSVKDRKQHLIELCNLDDKAKAHLLQPISLPEETADKMIENVIGTFSLPLAVGLNFKINEKDYIIPMAVEEPSIVASAGYITKNCPCGRGLYN